MLNVSEIIDTVKQLTEVRIKLLKEDLQGEATGIISRIVILVLMGVTMMMILLFASISLAFYLSLKTNSSYMGFLLVALIYVILFVIFYIIRDSQQLQNPISNFFKRFLFLFKK
ncbi:phage holin family protein [Pararhodonellum marinum]|uniref:phage holin family protein n=1 Tax=Pararhodonellum marinum TaxID=2755358 RepID=UPI0018901A5E|nr:phage holin family protein [Pararhodonellum marinum]